MSIVFILVHEENSYISFVFSAFYYVAKIFQSYFLERNRFISAAV